MNTYSIFKYEDEIDSRSEILHGYPHFMFWQNSTFSLSTDSMRTIGSYLDYRYTLLYSLAVRLRYYNIFGQEVSSNIFHQFIMGLNQY